MLRPGGVALVFEHNSWNPLTARVVSNCEFDKNAVLLPARQTERLLVEQGFGKVDTSYFLAIPMRGRWVRRTEALFRHIPIGAQYFTRGMA